MAYGVDMLRQRDKTVAIASVRSPVKEVCLECLFIDRESSRGRPGKPCFIAAM